MFGKFKKQVLEGFKLISNEFGSFKKEVLERFDGIDQKLDEHTNILDEHSQQIDSLRASVILIEDKVMTEFPALFEAFELHQEMHKDYDEKNSYLSLKVEEDSIRISALEDKIKFV